VGARATATKDVDERGRNTARVTVRPTATRYVHGDGHVHVYGDVEM
jgi:hypothetical protein